MGGFPFPANLSKLYASMVRIRLAEEAVANLVETGEVNCPCHLYIGQEGIAVGVCAALEREDIVYGAHRSHGHYLAKGGGLKEMMAEIFGKETGCAQGRGGSMHLVAPEVGFPGSVPIVGATIPISVGAALASKLRGDRQVSVSFFGDGAVEEGIFHESMNLAASKSLPVIFVCENNLLSSHMHLLERRAEDNIVQSASGHGLPGVRLDGNDVLAVFRASTDAVRLAREGGGPTLLECRTYRWRGHVGPHLNIEVGMNREADLNKWMKKDPIARLRAYMEGEGIMCDGFDEIEERIHKEMEDSVRFARESPFPNPDDLKNFVFK